MRAHPRSRGEHFAAEYPDLESRGSSPLTRGAQERQERWRVRPGLIPAHAGSTVVLSSRICFIGAHPRSRGEHEAVILQRHVAEGLIPAHAGSTISLRADLGHINGSSPLTRGARRAPGSCAVASGLIPAHAGSTERVQERRPVVGAHPRSRGEHPYSPKPAARAHGSSPLTRGAHFPSWGKRGRPHLIRTTL